MSRWFHTRKCIACPWSFQCPVEQRRFLCRSCESANPPHPIFEKRERDDA
jgi:hypothetical protein